MEYEATQIQTALQLLEGLAVSGTDNMKRIIFIKQILENPKEKNNDSIETGFNGK